LLAGRFFETVELNYLKTIVPLQATILEVGANIGNHLVYYALFMEPKRIIPIEPNPAALILLKKNIELNKITTADASLLGFGVGDAYGHCDLYEPEQSNMGATRLISTDKGAIEVFPLDAKLKDKIDFMKVDVEGMEMEVLRGARQLIENSQPILFIEIMNANIEAFRLWTKEKNYRVIKIFPYINAKNFVAAPASHPLASTVVSY
jgi:FkbM family methyltransferase